MTTPTHGPPETDFVAQRAKNIEDSERLAKVAGEKENGEFSPEVATVQDTREVIAKIAQERDPDQEEVRRWREADKVQF